jgi:hypothetical protein
MKKMFITIILVFLPLVFYAQPTPGGRPDDGGAGTHEDTQMPIATGTLLLLGLGVFMQYAK